MTQAVAILALLLLTLSAASCVAATLSVRSATRAIREALRLSDADARDPLRPVPSRVVLPMSSEVNILPCTTAQITSSPQTHAFRPERILLGGNPVDWLINDIKIDGKSQLLQDGDVPGEMFAAATIATIDSFVRLDAVAVGASFEITATFIGDSPAGAPFVCGVLGTATVA